MDLKTYEGGYWGYLNEDVRMAIAGAIDAIEHENPSKVDTYLQFLDDGFNTVAVNSFEVGIHGMGCLGGVNFTGLPTYADNTAAASLPNGTLYKTATGEVRIKV